jgi:hypothetical protein
MKTEEEIRTKIKEIEKNYNHILTGSFATIFENAPRAMMQQSAVELLSGLYFCIDEKRPQYEFEKNK